MTHLYARKKVQIDHDEETDTPDRPSHPSPSSRLTPSKSKDRGRKGSSELGWALVAVVGFIFLGLFLGYVLLHNQHRTVISHVLKDPWGHGGGVLRGRAGFRHHFYTGSPRYVTVVMPSVVNQKGRMDRLEAIQDTWGPGARSIFVVHNISEFPQASHAVVSEESLPEDPYAYPQLLLVPPGIGFNDGLPRLYHTIRTVFEKVDPDFAFFVNDHTFVIPEHLCKYLKDRSPNEDLYAGHAMKNGKLVFNSGAAGYVLSRSTMRKMMNTWDERDPDCWVDPEAATSWLQGNPGLATVQCLESMGIKAFDTRADSKWHRFHAFPLTRVVSGDVDDWYNKKHAQVPGFSPSYDSLLSGEDCCATDSVSFHYVEWRETKALFDIRGALLRNPKMSDRDLKTSLFAEWPASRKDSGFYSHPIPHEDNREAWKPLLATLRKISTRATQQEC
jgi:hypothetical protein